LRARRALLRPHFSSYEAVKRAGAAALGLPPGAPPPAGVLLAAGAAAGATSWAVALPADVVKSVVQAAPLDAPPASLRWAAVAARAAPPSRFPVVPGQKIYASYGGRSGGWEPEPMRLAPFDVSFVSRTRAQVSRLEPNTLTTRSKTLSNRPGLTNYKI